MKYLMATVALLVSTAATAGDDTRTTDASNDDNKLICKRVGETGSRLGGQRVCMTKVQWAEQKRQLREDLERRQTTQVNKQGM